MFFFQMDFWPKNGQIWPKLAFSAKYQHFWHIWSNAWPKNNSNKLPKWFSVMSVPKLLLNPIKIRLFGPKTAKFGPKSAFLVILGQILPFFAHFVQWPTKNNVNKVPRWVFRYVGNKTFDFSSKKKGFFAPKRPNLAQNWHFWSIWARPCRLLRCPVSGSVGGCDARAVSRKTPIYFIIVLFLGWNVTSPGGHSTNWWPSGKE